MKQFTSKAQSIGKIGEDAAVAFLMKHGYRVIERNIANKYGEIDIVASKGALYYFFEVKAGKYGGFINPAENLTPNKLRKFHISVEHYCYTRNIKEYLIQAILVLLEGDKTHSVEIIDIS